MHSLLLAALLAGPWVESSDFPKPVQEKAYGATLRVQIPSRTGDKQGTAVRIGEIGGEMYYLTAAHIIAAGDTIILERFDPKTNLPAGKADNVRVEKTWPDRDLALLRATEPGNRPFLRVCPEGELPKGLPFPALSVGCTDGNAPEIWLDEAREPKLIPFHGIGGSTFKRQCWPVGRTSKAGRSGGPLISKDGYLIGICSGNTGGNGYYVHIGEIYKSLKDAPGCSPLYEKPAPKP